MGFFDKFKSKFERLHETRKPVPTKGEKRESAIKAATAEITGSESGVTRVTQAATGAGNVAYRVLVKPYVTEKTATLTASGKYVFVVRKSATKLEVKEAVRELYGTIPQTVRIINRAGKEVRFGARIGTRKDWKKAIVTMPEGKTLPIYE